MSKKILLAYISDISGHRSAAMALENVLRDISPNAQILSINLFNYTNPYSEKVINSLYTAIIKNAPGIWEYLYDNPKVVKGTKYIKDIIHRFNSRKIKRLLTEFAPDAIVCTQAFPCGMFADFKKRYGLGAPLFGVVTDFFPHSYWVYNNVDYYIVASEEARLRLIQQGVAKEKVKLLGIPIDTKFALPLDKAKLGKKFGLDCFLPTVLIMGGGQGLGPIKTIVRALDRLDLPLQLIVVSGINKRLFRQLKKLSIHKKCLLFEYVGNVEELMALASIIVTKPGGLTISEALAKSLICILVNPIPGQEENNTRYLLEHDVAFRVKRAKDVAQVVSGLLADRKKYRAMQVRARFLAWPRAALDLAELIIRVIEKQGNV